MRLLDLLLTHHEELQRRLCQLRQLEVDTLFGSRHQQISTNHI